MQFNLFTNAGCLRSRYLVRVRAQFPGNFLRKISENAWNSFLKKSGIFLSEFSRIPDFFVSYVTRVMWGYQQTSGIPVKTCVYVTRSEDREHIFLHFPRIRMIFPDFLHQVIRIRSFGQARKCIKNRKLKKAPYFVKSVLPEKYNIRFTLRYFSDLAWYLLMLL